MKTTHALAATLAIALFAAGCPPSDPSSGDAGVVIEDAGSDLGAADASDETADAAVDAGGEDAGAADSGAQDAAPEDAGDEPDLGPPGDPASLRIATWNVSYLDVLGGSDEAPRTQEDYDLLRSYVARLQADVVAVQEVRGVAGTQTIFPADAWSAECEARDSAQNICVVARTASGWELTRNPDFVDLNVGNANLRQGLDLTISRPGHAPLRVLAVHLKSGCFFGENGTGCGTFFAQIDRVEEWVDARATAGEAYAVLGDFNRVMTAGDVAWLELDDAEPAGADLTRSIPQGTPTPCWSELFTEFIDHIILDPTSAGWLQESGQIAYDEVDFEEYYLRLSDHCPLWADLKVPTSR